MKQLLTLLLLTALSLTAAAEWTPANPQYPNHMATVKYQAGDLDSAIVYYKQYLQQQTPELYQEDKLYYDQAAANLEYIYSLKEQWQDVIDILPLALRSARKTTQHKSYNIAIEAAKNLKNDTLYNSLIARAQAAFPDDDNYFQMQLEQATTLEALDKLLATHPDNPQILLAKTNIIMREAKTAGSNLQARETLTRILAADPANATANTLMADTYLFEAEQERLTGKHELAFTTSTKGINIERYKKDLAAVQHYYFNALQYLQTARASEPDNTDLWADQLMQCYKMLQMKQQERELRQELNQ